MNEPSENKLLSLLVEIQSDIRQIKSDLQSLLTFLKEQQKPTPVPPPDGDHAPTRRTIQEPAIAQHSSGELEGLPSVAKPPSR
jgi:hypothetical protein